MSRVATLPLATMLCTAIALVGPADRAVAQSDPDAAVQSGREALQKSGGFWGYRWYDSVKDETKVISVRPDADLNWLADWFEKWFGWLGNWNVGEVLATLGWILLAVALGVLAYLLIRAYLDRESAAGRTTAAAVAGARASSIERVEALPVPVRDPNADFLAEAQRHYRQGNLAEAIIYLFSYQLIELDRHNLLRLAKGKTNRQYVREVDRRQQSPVGRPLAGLLRQTMSLFEESFFGGRPPERSAFELCLNNLGEFQAQLVQQPGAAPA